MRTEIALVKSFLSAGETNQNVMHFVYKAMQPHVRFICLRRDSPRRSLGANKAQSEPPGWYFSRVGKNIFRATCCCCRWVFQSANNPCHIIIDVSYVFLADRLTRDVRFQFLQVRRAAVLNWIMLAASDFQEGAYVCTNYMVFLLVHPFKFIIYSPNFVIQL